MTEASDAVIGRRRTAPTGRRLLLGDRRVSTRLGGAPGSGCALVRAAALVGSQAPARAEAVPGEAG